MALWNDIGELIHSMWEDETNPIFTKEECNKLAVENCFVDKYIAGGTWKALLTHDVIKEVSPNNFTLGKNNAKVTVTSNRGTTQRNSSISISDWIGKTFANNWEILRKLSREEELELGMGTHNAHFECINHTCGMVTCFEKTSLNRYMKKEEGYILPRCQRCNPETCEYKDPVRKQVGRDAVTADYSKNKPLKAGDVFGLFEVVRTISSVELGMPQSHAIVKCIICGEERECLYHHLRNHNVACDCFRRHSSGEAIVKHILEKHNTPYEVEYKFRNLVGDGGGSLRYDFAILNNDKVVALIEFDGEQHFEEAGSYYNPTGKVQIHDKRKDDYAAEHNIPLLRIPYDKAPIAENLIVDFLKNI